MEQTVVEYLVKELNEKAIIGGTIDRVLMNNIIEKAKEIEKQQIIDAHYDGKGNGMDISHPLSSAKEISAEEYYNEKFKNNKI